MSSIRVSPSLTECILACSRLSDSREARKIGRERENKTRGIWRLEKRGPTRFFALFFSIRTFPTISEPTHAIKAASCKKCLCVREGTFFLGGGGVGGLGPQRGGTSVKVSTKRGGPYLM